MSTHADDTSLATPPPSANAQTKSSVSSAGTGGTATPPKAASAPKTAPTAPTAAAAAASLPLPKPPTNPGSTVPAKTLWMGDIDAWWDEQYIGQLWAKQGMSVMVKVIKPKRNLIMRQLSKNHNAQPMRNHSGYCFVEFETPEQAKEALAFNGSAIPDSHGKPFRLNWATGATLNSQIEQTPEYSLFVGDLSPGTTEAHLLALFQTHFDTVKAVRVMTDPATGLSRCFGFVRFTKEDDRNRALVEMNGRWLEGRPIRVALATPKHQAGGDTSFHRQPSGGGLNSMGALAAALPDLEQQSMYLSGPVAGPPPMGYYAAALPPQLSAANSPTPMGNVGLAGLRGAGSLPSGYTDPTNTTVFVGGLAAGVSEDMLHTLFQPFGPIVNVRVPPGKGCGFVKFESRENAEQAVAGMQGFVVGNSQLRLSWGRSSGRHSQRQLQPQPQPLQPQFQFQSPYQQPAQLQNQSPVQSQQMMMAAGGSPLPPVAAASFDYAAGLPQQLPGMLESAGLVPPQGPPPQGTPTGLVGIPPGAQMFYDPYFAAAAAQQQQQQQQQQQHQLDEQESELQRSNSNLDQQRSGMAAFAQQTGSSDNTNVLSPLAHMAQSSPGASNVMGGLPGIIGAPGLTLEGDGMPPPVPQQFFDTTGQFVYMAQPFPSPMMPPMNGGDDTGSAFYASSTEAGSTQDVSRSKVASPPVTPVAPEHTK